MYYQLTRCRACLSTDLIPVFDLGVQPLANAFTTTAEEQPGFAPLKVLYCPKCTLSQLSVVVDPKVLYSHYAYVTSPSKTMAAHFSTLAYDIGEENGTGSLIEIGSNDGSLMLDFQQRGYGPILGIDPAMNLCSLAYRKGFMTITQPFGFEAAAKASEFIKSADVILARHVFCHANDWHEFIAALNVISHDDTLVCIEVPHVETLLKQVAFDTIYHEHLSYLSVRAIDALLDQTGYWHLHKIIEYPMHGGAILLMLRRDNYNEAPDESVARFLISELVTQDRWEAFNVEAQYQMQKLTETVECLVENGHSVCGFGASAKSTVWINACHFTEKEISFITDTTALKIGKFSPGSRIPIVSEEELIKRQPDYAVMWSWNYRDEILAKHSLYRQRGGKFIIPVPKVEIV